MAYSYVLNQIKTILTVDSHPIVATGKLYMFHTIFAETGNQSTHRMHAVKHIMALRTLMYLPLPCPYRDVSNITVRKRLEGFDILTLICLCCCIV